MGRSWVISVFEAARCGPFLFVILVNCYFVFCGAECIRVLSVALFRGLTKYAILYT